MTTQEKVQRILSTRLGTRPGHPTYGSRMYLIRDRRADGQAAVWFAKYAHEDIQRSDPELVVVKAELVEIQGDVLRGRILLSDKNEVLAEVRL